MPTNRIVNYTRIGLFALLALPCTSARATSRAVSEANYEFSFNTADTYSSGNRSEYYYQLGLRANFPLGSYLGTSLSTHYGATTLLPGTNNVVTVATHWDQCVYHSKGIATSLFARAPDIGRIGIGYDYNRLNSSCQASFIATGANTLYSNTYSGNAEYYFKHVTIAAVWSHTEIRNDGTQNSDSLSLAWYPSTQSRFKFTANGLALKNTYDFDVEYQPDFLGNRLGLSFDYISQQQTVSNKTYVIGVRYYFDADVDLLKRDRSYR